MVVLDASIIIDHIRNKNSISFFQSLEENYKGNLAISLITIQELYVEQSTKKYTKENELLLILTKIAKLPYTYTTAVTAGKITRDSQQSIDFPDAAIAATCIQNAASLATLNVKHFKGIAGLKIIDLENYT